MSVFIESPEFLECQHPSRHETVWTDMPEANEWETWEYADGWVYALCPKHAAEVWAPSKIVKLSGVVSAEQCLCWRSRVLLAW